MELNLLEYQVLSALRDRLWFLKHVHILSEDLFESPPTRFLYRIITNHHQTMDSGTLTIRSLRLLLNSSIKPGDEGKFRGVIRKIRRNTVKDQSVIDTLIKRFAQRQKLKQAVMQGIDSLDAGEVVDLERIRQKIDEAIGIGSVSVEDSYDYFHDPLRRIHDEANVPKVATGICRELDEALGGGLGEGELGLVIAPTGIGKTLTLINIGYGAMRQGKKVIHATLEISHRKVARRYDIRIADSCFKDVREHPELVQKKLSKLRSLGAGLQIKDYTSVACSVLDLRAYLERLRSKGFDFDVVIIDYSDLMYSSKGYKERRHELTSIIVGLRRMAAEFKVPIWTASQAGRQAGASGKTRLWDIAEDIGKANTADYAITISQNEQEKEEGQMWLKLNKARNDQGNPKINILVNYASGRMWSPKREIADVRRRLRS